MCDPFQIVEPPLSANPSMQFVFVNVWLLGYPLSLPTVMKRPLLFSCKTIWTPNSILFLSHIVCCTSICPLSIISCTYYSDYFFYYNSMSFPKLSVLDHFTYYLHTSKRPHFILLNSCFELISRVIMNCVFLNNNNNNNEKSLDRGHKYYKY